MSHQNKRIKKIIPDSISFFLQCMTFPKEELLHKYVCYCCCCALVFNGIREKCDNLFHFFSPFSNTKIHIFFFEPKVFHRLLSFCYGSMVVSGIEIIVQFPNKASYNEFVHEILHFQMAALANVLKMTRGEMSSSIGARSKKEEKIWTFVHLVSERVREPNSKKNDAKILHNLISNRYCEGEFHCLRLHHKLLLL